MKTFLKASLAGAVLLGGMAGFVWQRQTAGKLQRMIALGRRENQELRRLPEENQRLREMIARGNQTEASRLILAEIPKAREEVAALELRLRQPVPPSTPTADEISTNRDPEKGVVRLEHFRDKGRASPGAAFQTLVWAVTKGEDGALASLFAVSPSGREKLQAILGNLPPETRRRFDPPEKLLGMLVAYDVLDEEGFQIVGETTQNSGQTILRVRQLKHGRIQPSEKKLPWQRGPDGWQLPISDTMIDGIPAALARASLYVPPARR